MPNLKSPARNECRIATGYMPLTSSSMHPYASVGKVRSFDAIQKAMHEISRDDISPINELETPERSTDGKSPEIFSSIIRRENMDNPQYSDTSSLKPVHRSKSQKRQINYRISIQPECNDGHIKEKPLKRYQSEEISEIDKPLENPECL